MGSDTKTHLLSGLVKCPVCGVGMYGNKSIKVYRYDIKGNRSWKTYWTLQQVPSKKAMKKIRANIKEVFASPSRLLLSIEDMVKLLNPKIIGMRNYYTRRFTRPWMWKIDKYINQIWL